VIAVQDSAAQSPTAQPSPEVVALFPPGVVAAELHGGADAAALHADELLDCAGFGVRRLADFAAGRCCARRALRELGWADAPLRRGADRRPLWPRGAIGSISHTSGFCAAVVAPNDAFRSIGLDVELAGRAGDDLWPTLFTPGEAAALDALPQGLRRAAASVAFSAKEAYYKCQFGVTGAWLDFSDVEIVLENGIAERGAFRVDAARPLPGSTRGSVRGRYAFAGDFVMAGVALGKAW